MTINIPSHLTDDALMAAAVGLAGDECEVTARLVAHLAEIDRRELYVPAGYSSLYTYIREGLGYSEDAAFNRKAAALVARRWPAAIDMLADGRLSMTAVKLLAPILKDDNWERTFAQAARLSKRDVEELVARLAPKPDVPSTVRRIPRVDGSKETATGVTAATPSMPTAVPERPVDVKEGAAADAAGDVAPPPPRPAPKRPIVAPLAPERYRVQFTIGEETERKLRRLQTLLKREIPDGDPAVIFDRALTLLLAHVEGRKYGLTSRPRTGRASSVNRASSADQASSRAPVPGAVAAHEGVSAAGSLGSNGRARPPLRKRPRTMPAGVRRIVGKRDDERCTFVGADGRRCTERAYLEYHHAGVPFAHGGAETATNIALHCRAHNAYEGARIFGRPLPREVREARILYDSMLFPVPERQP